MDGSAKFYTAKQLSGILDTPDSVVRKKVEKYQFKTDKKFVDGRMQKVIFLSNEELQALKHEIENNKKIFGSKKVEVNHFESDIKADYEQTENINNTDIPATQQAELIKLIFNEVDKIHKGYKEEIVNVNLQNRLLTDSEKKKEEGYLEQIAELKTTIQKLQDELKAVKEEKKPEEKTAKKDKTFFGFKISK